MPVNTAALVPPAFPARRVNTDCNYIFTAVVNKVGYITYKTGIAAFVTGYIVFVKVYGTVTKNAVKTDIYTLALFFLWYGKALSVPGNAAF